MGSSAGGMPDTPAPPSVCVVIPTHDRPELLRRAIRAVLAQDYDGPLEVIVVHDGSEPDPSNAHAGPRPVRVVANDRVRGLSGARNTGILASGADLIAFCDDDDLWRPPKLSTQVACLGPDAVMATTAIEVHFGDKRTVRRAGTDRVDRAQLLRSRMSMLHSSTFLFRAAALHGELGLVAEDAPGSQNEDWDILLRAARLSEIAHVDEPLVDVLWGPSSFFSRRWDSRNASLEWMLRRHPDIAGDPVGYSRVLGQLAFGSACLSRRRDAWRQARAALTAYPAQWRAPVAAAVAVVPAMGEPVLRMLNRFGRGV